MTERTKLNDADWLRCLSVMNADERVRLEQIADRVEMMEGVDRVPRDAYVLRQIAELREHVAQLESRLAEVLPQLN